MAVFRVATLTHIRSQNLPIEITVSFRPYILNPNLKTPVSLLTYLQSQKLSPSTSPDGRQKYMYLSLMSMYFSQDGTSPFNFSDLSKIGPSFDCHRLVQWLQESPQSAEVDTQMLEKMVGALYKNHYCTPSNPHPPAAPENLRHAMSSAGVRTELLEKFLADPNLHSQETKNAIRGQLLNGIDSIPRVIFEGRRRDLTLLGLKKMEDYVKALEQIIKESI